MRVSVLVCDDAQIRIFFFLDTVGEVALPPYLTLASLLISVAPTAPSKVSNIYTMISIKLAICFFSSYVCLPPPSKANLHLQSRPDYSKAISLTTTSALLCGGTLLTKEVVHRTLLTLTTSLGANIVE